MKNLAYRSKALDVSYILKKKEVLFRLGIMPQHRGNLYGYGRKENLAFARKTALFFCAWKYTHNIQHTSTRSLVASVSNPSVYPTSSPASPVGLSANPASPSARVEHGELFAKLAMVCGVHRRCHAGNLDRPEASAVRSLLSAECPPTTHVICRIVCRIMSPNKLQAGRSWISIWWRDLGDRRCSRPWNRR